MSDQLSQINARMTEMGGSLNKMAEAITELAVTSARNEERHANHSQRVDRIEKRMDTISTDLADVKKNQQSNTIISSGVVKVTGIVVVACVGLVSYVVRGSLV